MVPGMTLKTSDGITVLDKWPNLKHRASLYQKAEGLSQSIAIIFKAFHWLNNNESHRRAAHCAALTAGDFVVVRQPFQLLPS